MGEPLKGKMIGNVKEINGIKRTKEPSNMFYIEDIKSAVEWLKHEIWNNTAFVEHLTEKQQMELRETIDKAFPDLK